MQVKGGRGATGGRGGRPTLDCDMLVGIQYCIEMEQVVSTVDLYDVINITYVPRHVRHRDTENVVHA